MKNFENLKVSPDMRTVFILDKEFTLEEYGLKEETIYALAKWNSVLHVKLLEGTDHFSIVRTMGVPFESECEYLITEPCV